MRHPYRKMLCVLFAAIANCALGQELRPGLQAGDMFSARIKFSNMWTEYRVVIPVRRPSASAAGKSAMPRKPPVSRKPSISQGQSVPQKPSVPSTNIQSASRQPASASRPSPPPSLVTGNDPLFVTMVMKATVLADRSLHLAPAVHKVHYYDGFGDRWTRQPHKNPGAVTWAKKRARKLGVEWRNPATKGLKREALREQLLGLAIICFDRSSLKATIDPVYHQACLPDFRKVAVRHLGDAFPHVFQNEAQSFFSDAIGRLMVQSSPALEAKEEFEHRRIPHRVDDVFARDGRLTARLMACDDELASGTMVRSMEEVDVQTGLVLNGRYSCRRDAYRRNSSVRRLQIRRWETTLLGYDDLEKRDDARVYDKYVVPEY